jgi:hypothetical protein
VACESFLGGGEVAALGSLDGESYRALKDALLPSATDPHSLLAADSVQVAEKSKIESKPRKKEKPVKVVATAVETTKVDEPVVESKVLDTEAEAPLSFLQ